MDFHLGTVRNVLPIQTLPLPLSKGFDEPEKGESYESSIYNRGSTGVGGPGHDTE
jgi:hypothetical protein